MNLGGDQGQVADVFHGEPLMKSDGVPALRENRKPRSRLEGTRGDAESADVMQRQCKSPAGIMRDFQVTVHRSG